MSDETLWVTTARSLDDQMAELTVQLSSGGEQVVMIPRVPLVDVEEADS